MRSERGKQIRRLETEIGVCHDQLGGQTNGGQTNKHILRNIQNLTDELNKLRKTAEPPQVKHSHHKVKKEECMSRQFWASAFQSGRGDRTIEELNKVHDWDDPPAKNASLPNRTTEVANEAAKFFANLAKTPTLDDGVKADEKTLLDLLGEWGVDDKTSDEIGKDIDIDELIHTMVHLPEGKSAGPDRIPNEFYKHFSSVLAPTLLRILNEGRQNGSFFEGFNEGIVSLLYKKGSRHDVRNYRPVTLLNGDYKILTRILAKRMLRIVTQFVSPEQIGFVPRTFIAETTMFIKLLQTHLEHIDEGGVLVFLDMEKAFDRVSWRFLKRGMRKLRFTNSFMTWIDILYDERAPAKRRIYANGKLSEYYCIHVGVSPRLPPQPPTVPPDHGSLHTAD